LFVFAAAGQTVLKIGGAVTAKPLAARLAGTNGLPVQMIKAAHDVSVGLKAYVRSLQSGSAE
jgi:hypothetical protein